MQVRETRAPQEGSTRELAVPRVTELLSARSLGALLTADGARVQISAMADQQPHDID